MQQTASERRNIPRAYEPKSVEGRVYKAWVDGGYFTPVIDPAKKPFVVIMPPPNVTGELHMGHALTAALEDLMVRWHRMRGEPTLFLPGSDHAGIATQVVVERMLASDGVTRHDIGRAAVRRARLELGRPVRQPHRRAAQAPGSLVRLDAEGVHPR